MHCANKKNIETKINLFPNHLFFNVKKAAFSEVNSHVDYLSLPQRILNEIPSAGINFGLSLTTYLAATDIFNTYLGDKNLTNIQYVAATVAAMATTLYTSVVAFNKTKNRTLFYSQDNKNPLDSEISIALQKIEKMIPDLYIMWKEKLKIRSHDELLKHLQKHYKAGMCFGYTIGAIEALADHPDVSGYELIQYLNYQTVIEKITLQIIREELTEQDNVVDALDSFISSSEMTMQDKITQLSYQTARTDYLNNQYEEIDVKSTSPNMMMNHFYQQAALPSFIDSSHYTLHPSLNRAKHFVKKDVVMTTSEKKQLEELKNSSDPRENFIDRLSKINQFKRTLNLSTRKDNYIRQHLGEMSQDTILAGEILLNDGESVSHSIMFRHSNGLYYFIDSNFGVDEFQSSEEFFEGLHNHLMNYYYPNSNGKLKMGFIMHALNTKNQLHTFQHNKISPTV